MRTTTNDTQHWVLQMREDAATGDVIGTG
ncbi:hypothetical protein UFOVP1504_1, partial [uncultured Caudovirales phage]